MFSSKNITRFEKDENVTNHKLSFIWQSPKSKSLLTKCQIFSHSGRFILKTFLMIQIKSIQRYSSLLFFSFFIHQSVELFIENIFLFVVKSKEAKGETRVEDVLWVLISFMLFKSINYDFFMVWIVISTLRLWGVKKNKLRVPTL